MPDLYHTLANSDIGHLRIVAALWGVELRATEAEKARQELCTALLEPTLAEEILTTLPADARRALIALAEAEGRLPWATFARRFGEIRPVGPARRDREQVYLQPISPAEMLFYRALLGRAFFDTPVGPQEFAYLPDEFIPLVHQHLIKAPTAPASEEVPPGRLASPLERQHPLPASDRLLDDLVLLLAALRMNVELPARNWHVPLPVLRAFLEAAGLLREGMPQPEAVRTFLEGGRSAALKHLTETWRESRSFNELRQLPGLIFEGTWENDPLTARHFLLDLLRRLPRGQWWSLNAFVRAIKETHPDFQRPAGEYDSWFIRRASDEVYLRGFEHWDEVDGALVRYLITGPLFWLGAVDLAAAQPGGEITAFKINETRRLTPEDGKASVTSTGRIRLPRSAPLLTHYLMARFCAWQGETEEEYRYRITPQALQRARQQGLKVNQLLGLLARNAESTLPPSLVRALKRWEAHGSEARLERHLILRVGRPEILEELRRSPAGRYLGDLLGPTAVIVREGAAAQVFAALASLGWLAEEALEREEQAD